MTRHRGFVFWEDVNDGEAEQWVATCDDCDWECDFPDKSDAEAGLADHTRP